MHTLTDAVEIIGKPRITSDGYMVVDSAVARIGVQEYYAAELGDEFKDLPANTVVRVDRPASVVFGDDSLASYAHKPLTNDHPSSAVTAETWKRDAIGWTGDEARQDGKRVRVPMLMADAQAIADVQAGKREWSAGYGVTFERVAGVNDDGEAYDARITSQKINHIALVDKGRAGPDCRIGDNERPGARNKGAAPVAEVKMTFDGVPFTVADATAEAVVKKIVDARDKAIADRDAAQALHDAAVAKLDAEIADLKTKIVDEATIDARAAEKAEVLADAKAIHDGDYAGKTVAEIKRAVVVAKVGDAMAGKSDDYIAARFDTLKDSVSVEDAKKIGTPKTAVNDAAAAEVAARDAYIARLTGKKES